MIDLSFESYQEMKIEQLALVRMDRVAAWTHHVLSFTTEIETPSLNDPEALVITDHKGMIVQIVLLEEGCDSASFQFTEQEKQQIRSWSNSRS